MSAASHQHSTATQAPAPTPTGRLRIDLWADIICPWCYIGAARLDRALENFEHRDQVDVVHRSFELEPSRSKSDIQPLMTMLRAKFGAQATQVEQNVADLAVSEGLGYRVDRIVGSTLDAHRLLHFAREEGQAQELLTVLLEANFAAAQSVFTPEALVELAERAGLDRQRSSDVLTDQNSYLADVRADEQDAVRHGARAVPFMLFGGTHSMTGSQDVAAITATLEQAWEQRATVSA